jgi:cell division protein FtsW
VASIVALVLVLTPLGHTANNAQRWIALGGVHVQPSEFAKLALILFVGDYLARNEGRLRDVVGVALPAVGLAVPVFVLVMLEPDFGTTVILAGIVGVLLFVGGLPMRWVAVLGGLGVSGLAGLAVLEPYRVKRLVSFLDPFKDPDGAGYQVGQGWIALASGGLYGQGLASGVAQRGFLPEAHTDFIAAVVGEELGAIGFGVLVLGYGVLIWRGTVIASRATDLYGMLVASATTALLGAQTAINLGVVTGLMPAKGLVLPFLSYGSSAVVVHAMCVGLLLRVGMEGRAFESAGTRVEG